ncbi:hypothetical protein [Algiphilus aromaticivorans]|uniref:hypothetical protein n=1 Tax=Algiphilus aromaticivorans TaxID=382454 RepID=UPI0005C1948E|nr:hypothetical protein [Algiphilus aromaticivorans]
MSTGGDGKVEETAEERELVRIGMDKIRRYREINKPIEDDWIARRQEQGRMRSEADREMTSQVRSAFGDARDKTLATAQRGNGLGSGAQMEAATGMLRDEATSMGIGRNDARQSADNDYVRGLQGVVQMGQGKSAEALEGLGRTAAAAGQQARFDARLSQRERASNMEGLGLAAGLGAQHAIDETYVPGKKAATEWASGYTDDPYKTIPGV